VIFLCVFNLFYWIVIESFNYLSGRAGEGVGPTIETLKQSSLMFHASQKSKASSAIQGKTTKWWLVFVDRELKVYRSPKDCFPKIVFDLQGAKASRTRVNDCCFLLHLADRRIFPFITPSKKEVTNWVYIINFQNDGRNQMDCEYED